MCENDIAINEHLTFYDLTYVEYYIFEHTPLQVGYQFHRSKNRKVNCHFVIFLNSL